jgi:hypothetical protein
MMIEETGLHHPPKESSVQITSVDFPQKAQKSFKEKRAYHVAAAGPLREWQAGIAFRTCYRNRSIERKEPC